MPNYLKMPKKSQVLALLELGWSYRRIEAETGVRRETVSGYDRTRRSNAAKTFPGSDASAPADATGLQPTTDPNAAKTFAGSEANPAKPFPGSGSRPRFVAALYRSAITEKLDAGLSLQRIWQDLVEEYGYGASYESVKRFVRTIAPKRRAVGVFHCARLSGMVEALPGRVAQAEAAPLPHLEFLELLVEDELARRADRLFARRLKQAGLTAEKTLADFDWTFNPKIPKAKIVELASARFIGTHAGVLLILSPNVEIRPLRNV